MDWLNFETTKDTNSIENIVCKPISELQQHPLNEDDMEFIVALSLINKDLNHPFQTFEGFNKHIKKHEAGYEMILKRVQYCFTFEFSNPLPILFLAGFMSKPGEIVLYLWYIQFWAFKHNIKEITLDIMMQKIFPFGFYSEEDLNKIWDKQKIITVEV